MQENSDRIMGFVLKHYREGAFDTVKAAGRHMRGAGVSFRTYLFAAVGVAAAVILGIFIFRGNPSVQRYEAVDSALVASLPDGSRVTLSEGSTLSFSSGKGERRATLEGTALFEVTHDETCPFTVSLGRATVKVLGTVFQIRETPSEVKVDVLEGKVSFSGEGADASSVILTSGTQSVLHSGSASPSVVEESLPNPTAWLTGSFRYEAVPLGTVLEELSDYYGKIFYCDPSASEKLLTGTFSVDDPDAIVSSIGSALQTEIAVTADPFKE